MTIDVKDFHHDVVERSHQEPVVVDFWAEWCGPCRVLGPVLEQLATQANGAWTLAKLDTEALPDVAARFGIRSIPTVKLFVDGRPTAEFTGALPERSVRQWLDRVLPSRHRADVNHAEALFAAGDGATARALIEKVLAKEPDNLKARILEAQILLFENPDRAIGLLAGLEEDVEDFQKVESVRTLATILIKAKDIERLPDGAMRDRYVAALQEVNRQHFDAALEHFIQIIREDRYYDDDGSRKACIAMFKYLGEAHEITLRHRRNFSSALY